MNKAIPIALCAALAACASPASDAPAQEVPSPEARAADVPAPVETSAINVDRAEVRYYVIADG